MIERKTFCKKKDIKMAGKKKQQNNWARIGGAMTINNKWSDVSKDNAWIEMSMSIYPVCARACVCVREKSTIKGNGPSE